MKKTILITGAGTGFGRDAAIALAERGHKIIAATYDDPQADTLRSELRARASTNVVSNMEVIKLDITDKKDRAKVHEYSIDVLLNNAAVGESGALAEVPLERILKPLEVNVVGTIGMIQAAVPGMAKRGRGTIILMSSLAGRTPLPFLAPYGMTKYALECAGADLKVELKPLGIKVAIIEPGAYATGFNEKNIARKYDWMRPDSLYKDLKHEIERGEKGVLGLQSNNTDQVVKVMIKVAEARNPRLRYAVPRWQGFGVQLLRAFGQ